MYFESNQSESMFSERENVFREYAMDCGFETEKGQGLFSNCDRRRGIVRCGPLDLSWADQIRLEGE
jgi:hypothetical protein